MRAEISKEEKMHKNTFGYTVCIQISCTFHLGGDQEMHPKEPGIIQEVG